MNVFENKIVLAIKLYDEYHIPKSLKGFFFFFPYYCQFDCTEALFMKKKNVESCICY